VLENAVTEAARRSTAREDLEDRESKRAAEIVQRFSWLAKAWIKPTELPVRASGHAKPPEPRCPFDRDVAAGLHLTLAADEPAACTSRGGTPLLVPERETVGVPDARVTYPPLPG
jgi:hypothetical protein